VGARRRSSCCAMLLTSSHAPYCVRAHTCRGRRSGVALGASLLRRRVHASRALVTLAVAFPPAPQQGDAAGAGAQARSAAVAPGAPIPGSWASATTSQERKRLLLAAIKPPIYSVAMVPVLVRACALSARHATPLHGSKYAPLLPRLVSPSRSSTRAPSCRACWLRTSHARASSSRG